ncbi:UNKNOWN [Stylonychia lemnae]|uniref:Uncharacterized protein n=1 Tax=Stylonychia lemnae TaxID=5949 RepID=A0A078BFD9_STYLE|nr:UNKNOWN [Stylonychia lemnae]|eukprot:CDW91867.1 UNKNOWN [Stylonychia lemnae]
MRSILIQMIIILLAAGQYQCIDDSLQFDKLSREYLLALYKNQYLEEFGNKTIMLANCKDNPIYDDPICETIEQNINQLLEVEDKNDQSSRVLKDVIVNKYLYFKLDCTEELYRDLCKSYDLYNGRKQNLRFIVKDQINKPKVYTYTSHAEDREALKLKLIKMASNESVQIYNGPYRDLESHEIVKKYKRSIIVLESKNSVVRKVFYQYAEKYKEKYYAFEVTQITHLDRENQVYAIQPDGYIQEFQVPVNKNYEAITEIEIQNIFRINALPRAIVLRSQVINNPQFLNAYGYKTIFVGLIDSLSDDFPAEFGYKFRDWSNQHTGNKHIAFAILDWSFVDRMNPFIFQQYGFKQKDTNTVFAISNAFDGNYFKQYEKYNGTNFDQISERFLQGVLNGEENLRSSSWKHQYLNILDLDYWKEWTIYRFFKHAVLKY